MAIKPAGADEYGAGSMSSDPGGRNKSRSFSPAGGLNPTGEVGETATDVEADATVNECAAAQDAVIKASRVVETGRIGLARSVESA